MSTLSRRERSVLHGAVTLGMEIIFNGKGVAHWDGDITLPFKAFKSLDTLVDKGLIQRTAWMRTEWYRVTAKARDYVCRAGCQRGYLYKEDTEIGKCPACEGTGIVLTPRDTQQQESGK